MNQDKSCIETYLVSTFSKIVDEYGQNLDITLALPTLVNIIKKGGQDDSDKKYHFIGYGACQFSVCCILAKEYPNYDERILDALSKKFRVFSRVNKKIWKDIDLKRNIQIALPQDIIQTIAGVLFTFFGMPAVEKFIQNAVIHIAAIELGEATATSNIMRQEVGPIHKFNLLLCSDGALEFKVKETASKCWEAEMVAKLKKTSIMFSHKRLAKSKQKAKSAVCQDVLNYFEQNPEVYQQLQEIGVESTDVHPLPILEQDFSVTIDSTTAHPSPTHTSDPNNIHISIGHDEDAVRQLSRLLLDCSSYDDEEDIEESPTKKRSRGLESMFCPPMNETVQVPDSSNIKQEQDAMKVAVASVKEEHDPMEGAVASVNEEKDLMEGAVASAKEEVHVITLPDSLPESLAPTEAMIDNYNPLIGSTPAVDINPKIIGHFKEVFKNNRNTLSVALGMPGQSKSILLSLVLQNGDKIECDYDTNQVGPPHSPVFSAKVTLKSKRYGNVFIITEGVSRKKKDAECHAFHKLVNILK